MKRGIVLLICIWFINPLFSQSTDRLYWSQLAYSTAYPVLKSLSEGKLKTTMPVEAAYPENRKEYAHLEALGRTLCGIAPWLELGPDSTSEGKIREELLNLAHRGLRNAVDSSSPDYMNFSQGTQPLVDAAFLAQAFIRSPRYLWGKLDPETQKMVIYALQQTRTIKPWRSNWLMFSATIEAFFLSIGESWDPMRIDYALSAHENWYKGDGVYGDGPNFHWDYYNSFVIQPMLVDVSGILASHKQLPVSVYEQILLRSVRYAQVLERFISPEGTFPPIGRSLAYRTGCMQTLSQMALLHRLPEDINPAQVRCALTAVAKRMFSAQGTFDSKGWLQIGFAGHQPATAEEYICTGSLYLCTTGFLQLGLPANDPFWLSPAAPWTSCKAWKGEYFPIDHAH